MAAEAPKTPITGEAPVSSASRAHIDNAIRALHEKKPVPEIDFTLHTMEDGSQVSTMERVCKGTSVFPILRLSHC